jgi:DNA invertase Pin-like site-specific DNA recombinase
MKEFRQAIGYIRVSTEEQAGEDRYGVDAQKAEILLYANKNDYMIVDWIQDECSGVSDVCKRPGFGKILSGEEITNPPFEAIITFKNDRVSRDTKIYFWTLYELEKRNIKLLSTKEQFDEGDELANIYRSLLLFVAEQERKNITLRTTAGRTTKARTGGYSGGRVPYGYKPVDGELVINDAERPVVELIFREHDRKVPMLQIVEILDREGYKTRKGSRFQVSTIKSVISNRPLYEGMYRYGGKDAPWVTGQHEPILKKEEVQDA